ncbi:MAG TPA: hypothetical protein GXX15_02700 [Clostridia bacterium]|nr:hypothetical protein [Clostridia bacterium]
MNFYNFIGKDLHKVIEQLPKDTNFKVVETKSIFDYKGSHVKVVRIKKIDDILEITVFKI